MARLDLNNYLLQHWYCCIRRKGELCRVRPDRRRSCCLFITERYRFGRRSQRPRPKSDSLQGDTASGTSGEICHGHRPTVQTTGGGAGRRVISRSVRGESWVVSAARRRARIDPCVAGAAAVSPASVFSPLRRRALLQLLFCLSHPPTTWPGDLGVAAGAVCPRHQ